MEALIFQCGEQRAAIDVRDVREFITLGPLTAVPSAPPIMAGVINVHGLILPVLDLSFWFGRDEQRVQTGQPGIVVEANGALAVLWGAKAPRVGRIEADEESSATGCAFRDQDGRLRLLDLPALFAEIIGEAEARCELFSTPHPAKAENPWGEAKQ